MPALYIVPTPIGNLEDLTLRALRILKEVDLIAAEDTRTTRVLLNHYKIHTPMISYHEHSKIVRLEQILDALAKGAVALVSDAGMPGISDPGYELIRQAIEKGFQIIPLPGANAILPALVASGLPTDSFLFLGFLPKKEKARRELLASIAHEKRALIAYESPYRLNDSLKTILEVLGDRPVCVAREISKLYEEFARGSISEVLAYFDNQNPRGEITLVIGGATDDEKWDQERVQHELQTRLAAGESLSQAARAIATESRWKKSDVYSMGIAQNK